MKTLEAFRVENQKPETSIHSSASVAKKAGFWTNCRFILKDRNEKEHVKALFKGH